MTPPSVVRATRWCVGGLLVTCLAVSSLSAAEGVAPADIFQTLKSRAEQFDDVAIEFTERGIKNVRPFPAWKYPDFARTHGLEDDPGAEIHYTVSECLFVRGAEITYQRTLDEKNTTSTNERCNISPDQKWGNARGHVRDYSAETDGVMKVSPLSQGELTGLVHLRLVSLAFGFGIGNYLKSVDVVEKEGDRFRIRGAVEFSGTSETGECDILLDSEFVPSTIDINTRQGSNVYHYEIAMEGRCTNEGSGFVCAKQGTLRLVKHVGASEAPEEVVEDFTVQCDKLAFGVDDELYDDFTSMEVPPATQVIDPLRLVARDAGPTRWRMWSVCSGLLLLVVLATLTFLRRRRTGGREEAL